MNPAHLLESLEKQEVRLELRGERLLVDAPRGVITHELRQTLEEHKPELVHLIQQRTFEEERGRQKQPSRPDQILDMSLDQFAQAGLIVRVSSKVLGQDVLFVSDNVSDAALANRTLPIYRADELRKLVKFGPSPTALTIHTSKVVFQGRIADVKTEEDP